MQLYGNLHNRIDENRTPTNPTEGMGATILMYSDRHAATIVQVTFGGLGTGPTEVAIQEDKSIRTDANGMSESQGYRYEPNTDAVRRYFTKRKNGRWVEKGHSQKNGTTLLIGVRDSYHDYGY